MPLGVRYETRNDGVLGPVHLLCGPVIRRLASVLGGIPDTHSRVFGGVSVVHAVSLVVAAVAQLKLDSEP
jgi:uncharacterized protein YjeT (DUF2065 family)